MNFLDESIFEKYENIKAERIWAHRISEYKKLYSVVRNRLPDEFLNEYEKQFFHDYRIVSIFPEQKKNYNYSLNIILEHHKVFFKITYNNVKMFKCNIQIGDSLAKTDLLQSEILAVDNEYMSHEFTVSGLNNNSVFIVFKKISLTNQGTDRNH